jgi:hypothetical protein
MISYSSTLLLLFVENVMLGCGNLCNGILILAFGGSCRTQFETAIKIV